MRADGKLESRMDRSTGAGEENRPARRARYSLYLVGGFFAALGIALEMVPVFAAVTPVTVAKGCVLFGALILAIGRFASDGFLMRCEALLTRRS
jgi:hypothetical protein